MSGPYNYGFRPPHGQSPMSPETPTSAYKIDVKRTKTKKWVEAKTQNYDGDDWGNDFDDEPDEPVPVPPLKPTMGFRQPSPSQATTANLPSNQPLTPQSAGPASMMRPQQPATNESALSSSPRATAGLPPLQTQTPPRPAPPIVHPESSDIRPQIVSGPSSMDSVSDKGPYEHLVSPQSANIGSGPGSNAGRHEAPPLNVTSPVGGRRTSPAPPQQQQQSQQPAQPQAARFPPRKSSMGQHDADRQANSRSGSTQPPWMEQRSRSPSTVRSPGTPSNAKAQPFVRPSDIYRRAENEREKERVSTESGRPSLDGVGGPRTERSISPANAPAGVGAGEHVRGNDLGLSKLQGEDAPQGNQRPVLEPVAERKSEYGFDRLLSQPQSQDQALPQPQPQPTTNITTTKSGSPQLAVPAHAPEPQYQRPTNEEVAEQRRYSSSPRLPDLARMSLFGDDFFSNPGKFADDAPPMPSLNSQQSGAALPAENLSTIDRTATPAALSTSSITPQRAESPMASGQPDKMEPVSPAQPPPTKENDEPVGLGLNSLPSRPSLPGGWVTETRSVTDEQTPPAVAEKKTAGMDPGEVSPITDNEDDELRGSGLATVKDRVSIPVSIPEASARVPQSHDRDTDKAEAAVKPLAPLNPRPSDHSPSDFVPPEKLQRESTMSTVTSPSPVKESDKLREEIMRSLSPVRPTSDFNDFNKNQASGLTVEDNGPRESTYLHGVYDDYWTAGDDKPDVPELPKKAEMDVKSSEKERDISGVPPLSPRKETAGTSPNLGRRFSWEGGSEQVTPGPADPQNNLLSEPQLQTASAAVVSPSLPSQDAQQPRAASSEQPRGAEQAQPPTTTTDETHIAVPPNSGTMSHQVSQVSSVPRDRLGSEAIEPPSPVSVVTDKNNASAAPTRRLSLAEEKSMVRVSSNPVSPSPPPGDHPALAQSAEATPPPASPEPSQQQPVAPVKITNFRDIMELQSASERINKYNETRAQFASMDSGLDNWLVNLKSQHPEHANATASFATNISNAGQGQSSPTTSQPNSQQPYYQQYLNASSTNVSTAAASGRPPAGSVSMGSHSPSSDFKHSSGQVGAKGKGLLLAAGKAGKGLLSKGKNKLRGTGDKNDSSPPPAQAQSRTKAERRTSWGISLGTRSSPRADSHARSASLSGSLSGPAPSSQTIPEHPASPTPPPQLPQTSRISPFDTLTQDRQASAWAPPRPQTPKHPAGALRDSDSEPVSPVSDTQSASAPKGHDKADDDGFDSGLGGGGDLQVPRPISKTQPSWDPFTGTPLVEEEGFEMGQSRDPSPHAHHAARASSVAQAQTTTSLAKNSTEDDDWVVVSPQSPPSGQVYVVSPESPPLARSFQPIEVSREISANEDDEESANRGAVSLAQQAQGQIQHHQPGQQDQPTTQHGQRIQHLPQQGTGYQAPQQYQYQHQTREQLPSQQQQVSPQRQSSFVGLPPIRRTSTFGMNFTKRAKKRFPLDEDEDDGHGLVSSPVGTTSAHFGQNTGSSTQGQQAGDGAFVESSQPVRVETGLSASRKDSAMSHQVISATSTQAATLATESTGVDWRVDDEKRPLDPQQSFRPGGPVPRPIDTNFATSHDGRSGGQPLAPGMRSQQGVVPPTVGGNPIQHLPPQGPWKLEESHLSEPLLPASRSRLSGSSTSPHQPFFGFDKETGVPSPMAPRQETQLPPRQKFSEVPPSSAQRYPELFTSPPQGYPNPGSPTGPRSSFDAGHHLYNRDNTSLQRTRTVDSEVSSVEPSGDDERGRGKRGSGFFKEVGGRFSRTSSRERQNFKDEVEPTGHPAESLERERMSVSSIGTVEMQDRQRRRSSFFLNLRGPKPSDAAQAQEGEGIPPSPKASPNPAVSPQIPHPGGPAERKRSWLGPGGNDSAAAPPSLSRSSTSTAGNEPAGGPKDPPKKRFSGLKVFNRTSSQQDLQPPPKPSTSHSVASSFHSHHSGNQLGVSDSQVTLGRERSNTTGSGPYGLMQTNKHLQTVGEEDRGRRSSASGFLSGLFGTRSSKTREAQQPADIASQQNQDPPQFRLQQQSGNQLLPSSLGPNRQMGPLPMRGPPQQFESQPQQTSLAQSSQQATNAGPQAQALEQRRADVSFLPVSQYSQPRSPPLDSQQSRHLAMTGARPVSEIESEDQNVPGRDVPGAGLVQWEACLALSRTKSLNMIKSLFLGATPPFTAREAWLPLHMISDVPRLPLSILTTRCRQPSKHGPRPMDLEDTCRIHRRTINRRARRRKLSRIVNYKSKAVANPWHRRRQTGVQVRLLISRMSLIQAMVRSLASGVSVEVCRGTISSTNNKNQEEYTLQTKTADHTTSVVSLIMDQTLKPPSRFTVKHRFNKRHKANATPNPVTSFIRSFYRMSLKNSTPPNIISSKPTLLGNTSVPRKINHHTVEACKSRMLPTLTGNTRIVVTNLRQHQPDQKLPIQKYKQHRKVYSSTPVAFLQDSSDDIYDSTPRLPSGPPPPPAQPIMATRTGQSQVSESSADEAPRNATHANGNANGNASATLTRGKSTRAELEDTEDERMRTIRLEAQEEKILVDPYEEKQSSGNKYRKEDDPDAPQMSATSYPGQEWNPYGAGGYEDWD
ncbi:hypothetical protein CkaCkLH20_13002 [Colletotrichum karsti]|uniref:SWI-SNF chromatin-remodeling complex protein n=1 Tax=Colletotrichum karsti TaxID=1095194 RepID=A0A9P6HS16_9PEZI|nr:uncharacterized protein CkaCkLH20_13002 [Colletotrichum karsti]KAF9869517.1 hypothetical protein CkaCkLH20_13002 [Colletotrichum karsti]